MNTTRSGDQRMLRLVAGRTLDEQIECIRKYGNHGVLPVIREMVLQSAGIAKPKKTAKNLIVFGCYMPFTSLPLLCDYTKILDQLGLEYTYLEKEFCCGLPMIETTAGVENDKAMEAGKEFMIMNRGLCLQEGIEPEAFCVWTEAFKKAGKSDLPGML